MKNTLPSSTKPTAAGVAVNKTKQNTKHKPQAGSPNLGTRRHFIQSAAALGSLAGVTATAVAADDAGKDKSRTALNQPLGQDYVVVTQVPDKNHFIHDPAMTILPNGCLIVAAPVWGRKRKGRRHSRLAQQGWRKDVDQGLREAVVRSHALRP